MSTLFEYILGFFQIHLSKVKAEDCGKTHFWLRKLNYTAGRDICENEQEEEPICETTCEEEDLSEEPCEADGGDEDADECSCEPTRFARKMKCLTRAAKYGMKEGALCGIFFGGGWGIYKWIEGKYLGGGGGSDESNEDSSTNTNLIFVTAANSAIAMGVVCTFICCTKAILYCN